MSSAVSVFVTSPDTHSERRFELHTTVGQLKSKLELITGIPVPNQQIFLHDAEGDQPMAVLAEDDRALGFYGLRNMQVLKVVDTNPSMSLTGQLHDTSGVEKFELSEEEYARRQDSVLAYKQRNKIGRFASPEAADATLPSAPLPAVTASIPIDARCEIESTEPGLQKRGTVRFIGSTKFAPKGVWVGVEYDEPMGKNDGSVDGERYFTCPPKHGVFVRPEKVAVGDFPVAELDLDDEEM